MMVNFQSVVGHDPATGRVLWRFGWTGDQPKVPQPIPMPPDRLLIAAGYGVGCQLLALQTSGNEDLDIKRVWESRVIKPKFSNLVVRDGLAYGLDDGKSLICMDLADGRRVWRGGRYGHGQVLLVDDVLLILAESGEVALVAAKKEGFEELTRFQAIEGKTWNTPALSGRRLLVRNAEEAACYELPLALNPGVRDDSDR